MSAAIDYRSARLAVVALALCYGAAHLAWYGTTPLGGFPVLDGREILELAQAIAGGTLVAEPFYRAPLYPSLVALFIGLGVPESFLPDAARLLNLVAHVASATLVFELARRVWGEVRAGLLAGALYALYPVALHFAGDPLDITLATTLALGATLAAWLAAERASRAVAVAAGALLALAALARPNFLVCLPALLLWFAVLARRDRRQLRLLASSALGCAVVLGAMGLVNKAVGDEFRLLPWQGSHAIWDANGPGAGGLYYRHTLQIPDLAPGTNPARAEAEILYCRERPCGERIDIDDFQAYWRGRFVDYLGNHPVDWIELLARKAWYLVNDYEQYNNKTYWVHKDRAPWLRWNPLGWALLLALAAGALWLPLRAPARSLLVVLASAYAVGLLLYFVSARFRVPMAGWLCVLAGGWALLPGRRADLARWTHAHSRAAVATAVAVGAIAAIPVAETLRQGTVAEDWSLLASAALAAGKWQEAENWSRRVIERVPDGTAGHALVCAARVQAWEQSPSAALPSRQWLEQSLGHCSTAMSSSHRAAYNAGFFLSGLCRQEQALANWQRLQDSKPVGEFSRSALAAVSRGEIRAGDAAVGILGLQRKPRSELLPGQQSLLAAIEGAHCDTAGTDTQQHQRAETRLSATSW